MQILKTLILTTMLFVPIACSLPPERPIKESELTPLFKSFEFEESPEEILAVLNKEGEVSVPAKWRGRFYWIKILATSKGLVVEYQLRKVSGTSEAPAATEEEE